MRRALLIVGLLSLVACSSTPNTAATQTRTSEIVELTVAARTLPTQNAQVPPPPISTGSTPAPGAPTVLDVARTQVAAPLPTPTLGPFGYDIPDTFPGTSPLIPGSWVASSRALRIRFFAPPSLVEAPQASTEQRFSLASPSNVYDFEALDVYRFVGDRGGDFARTWENEVAHYRDTPNHTGFVTTSGPRLQQVGAYQGNIGQFHYTQSDNGLPISGTIWVGQVGNDEVLIIYRVSPEREQDLDAEFAQVIATIDFNAT